MTTVKFKTNINCGGCLAAVSPALNKVAGQNNWTVDTSVPEKILTVKTENTAEIELAVRSAGFSIERIN